MLTGPGTILEESLLFEAELIELCDFLSELLLRAEEVQHCSDAAELVLIDHKQSISYTPVNQVVVRIALRAYLIRTIMLRDTSEGLSKHGNDNRPYKTTEDHHTHGNDLRHKERQLRCIYMPAIDRSLVFLTFSRLDCGVISPYPTDVIVTIEKYSDSMYMWNCVIFSWSIHSWYT